VLASGANNVEHALLDLQAVQFKLVEERHTIS
jgi:hypothetical protein